MWDLHAIQIETINYIKTYFEVNEEHFDPAVNNNDKFTLETAHTELMDDNTVAVKIRVLSGFNEDGSKIEDADFWMEVVIEGFFKVDSDNFPLDKVNVWADRNGPLILYPYAREVVQSLTYRVFDNGVAILPLLTVPTIKK
jgi:preprotein translocase subunit SecB